MSGDRVTAVGPGPSSSGPTRLGRQVHGPRGGCCAPTARPPPPAPAAHVAGLQPVFIPTNPDTFMPELEAVPRQEVGWMLAS